MTKLKIFKFIPENAEAISEFIQNSRLLQDGILISDGHIGFMTKELDDLGLSRDEMVNPISGELAKSQKQFLLQEGLERGYAVLENKFTKEQDSHKVKLDEAVQALNEHNKIGTFAPAGLLERITTIEKELDNQRGLFKSKRTTESDKEIILTGIKRFEEQLKPLIEEFNGFSKEYTTETNRLQGIIEEETTAMMSASSKIKENREKKENAIEDKEEAKVFMEVASNFLKDIKNGTLNKETGLLEFNR